MTRLANDDKVLNFEGLDLALDDRRTTVDGLNGRRGLKPNQRKQVKDGVDIMHMDTSREPSDTESTLEFILNTLCRALSMKPKQAAALLTNNNQFLVHCCVKGVKARFEPVLSWYNEVYLFSRHLSEMLEIELSSAVQASDQSQLRVAQQNFDKVLQTIGSGCYSQNEEVARLCLKTLTCMAQDLSPNMDAVPLLMKWFESKDNGIYTINYAIKKHSILAPEFVDCLGSFTGGGEQMSWAYINILPTFYQEPADYFECLATLLPHLTDKYRSEVGSGNLLSQMIEKSIRSADSDAMNSEQTRIAATALLADLWLTYSPEIHSGNQFVTPILHILKKNCRDRAKILRLVTAAAAFKLLTKFSAERNPAAPQIYKALIFAIVENPFEQTVREFYLRNFQTLFEKLKSIPVGLLVEPLVKSNQVQDTFIFQTFDYDFLSFVAKHPKTTLANSIQILDLLARHYLNDVCNANAASVPFMLICSRQLQHSECQEFMLKFITICLNQLIQIDDSSPQPGPAGGQLALPAPREQRDFMISTGKQGSSKEMLRGKIIRQEEEVNNRLKRSNIVTILLKIQNLQNEQINNAMLEMLFNAQRQYKDLNDGYLNNGIMAALRFYGDPDALFNRYMRSQEPTLNSPNEADSPMQAQPLALMQSKSQRKAIGGPSGSAALLPIAETQHNLRALHELELIKKFKKDRENEERLKHERQIKKQSMIEEKLKEELKKRRVDLGVARNVKGVKEELKALIYEKDEPQPVSKTLKKAQPLDRGVQLVDLNQEEERDREIIKEFLRRNRRIWKSLFQRYANQAYSVKGKADFDAIKNKLSQISLAEITKMMRDHNTYPQLLTKDELASLIRMINMQTKSENSSDLTMLDWDQFQLFIPQLAFFCFSRPPVDKSHYPPIESLIALVSTFEQGMRERGKSTAIYEDPDASPFVDRELILALEAELREDPNYELPEGFRKELQKLPCYEYKIPESAKTHMKESQIVATEIMDEFLHSLLGIHFLEPMVHFETRLKVKQTMGGKKKIQTEPHKYMQQVTLKTNMDKAQPKEDTPDLKKTTKALSGSDKRQDQLEVKPKLNLALKLQVTKQELKNRPHFQEVAEVLEEMLQATEKGLVELPPRLNRAPGQVQNEYKLYRAQKEKEDLEREKQREQKRQKHDKELKEIITDSNYGGRGMDIVKYRKHKEEKKKHDSEKQRKDEQQVFQKKAETLKKDVDKLRSKKQQEEAAKLKEEKARALAEKKQLAQQREQFLEKQVHDLQERFQETQKKRSEVEQKKQETEKMKQEAEKQLKDQMEQYIKSTKQDREIEKQERKDIVEFLNQPDVDDVFAAYDRQLYQLFKFYAVLDDKKDLTSYESEQLRESLSFKELIRFGYQQSVTPALLLPEDMVYIYKNLVREQNDSDKLNGVTRPAKLSSMIDFEGFKKALVRIAAMSFEKLGGAAALQNNRGNEKENMRQSTKKMDKQATKERHRLQSLKEQFKQEQEYKNQSLGKTSPTKVGKNEQKQFDQAKLAQEEEFFQKWLKQRENLGMFKDGYDGSDPANEIKRAKQKLLGKKDLSQKEIDQLNREIAENEKKMKIRIQNKQVRKQLDLSKLTAQTIKNLIEYLGLSESDTELDVTQKLTQTVQNRRATTKPVNQSRDGRLDSRQDEARNESVRISRTNPLK